MIVRRGKYNFVIIVFEPFLKMGIFLTYKIVSLKESTECIQASFRFLILPIFFFSQSQFQKRKANALTELLRDGGGLKKTLPVIWNVFREHPAEPPTVPFPVLWQDEATAPPAPYISQLLDFSSLQEREEILYSSFPFSCLWFLHFF